MSNSIYSQYETNKETETNGKFFNYGETEDGKQIRFKLALMYRTNKNYAKALDRVTKQNARAIELGSMSVAQSEKLVLDLFVKHILLGWENVLDRDGSELVFSQENAVRLLTDLPTLYDRLQADAREVSNFLEKEREEAAKN